MAATAGLPTLLLPLMQVLVCCVRAQSDLQLLRLTPSAVSMHLYQDPLSRNSQEETPEDQTTQFHAQDSSGRSLFGFSTPVQSRLEARDSDGAVRGSFSYRDPNGAHVKVQYWDEGNGFHVAANHLPVHYLAPVRDTPEVEAARRRHMEAYQQVLRRQLELLYHQQQQQAVDGDAAQAGDEGETAASDEGVRHPALPAQALYDPTQVHDALREAVVVEAPASRSSPAGGVHRGVLERTNVGGFPPAAVGGTKEAAVLQQLVRGAAEAKSLSSPPAGVSKEQLLLQPLSPARVTELPRAGPGGGFLYSFQYPHPVIPVTLRHGEQAAAAELPAAPSRRQQLSVSQRAALFGAVPVAAVHDAQVAPAQRSGDSSHQIKPVFLHHDDQPQE